MKNNNHKFQQNKTKNY